MALPLLDWLPVACSRVLLPEKTVSDRNNIGVGEPCASVVGAGCRMRLVEGGLLRGRRLEYVQEVGSRGYSDALGPFLSEVKSLGEIAVRAGHP